MLTDTEPRNLKLRDRLHKEQDRDGLHVTVSPHVFASLAHFGRGLIRNGCEPVWPQRVSEGCVGSGEPRLDEQQMKEIKALLRNPNIQLADVGRRYGVSRTTIYMQCGAVQLRHQWRRNKREKKFPCPD